MGFRYVHVTKIHFNKVTRIKETETFTVKCIGSS